MTMGWMPALLVFVGGGTGAVLRYGLSWTAIHYLPRPWLGTLAANLLGCTAIYLLITHWQEITPHQRLLWQTGLLGGLTTFSTFSLEFVDAFKRGANMEAALIFALNVGFGFGLGLFLLKSMSQ